MLKKNSFLNALYSLASAALTLWGTTVVIPESLRTGSSVDLFIIKDECRWPSPTNIDNPECRISAGKGAVVQGDRGDGYSIVQAEKNLPANAKISVKATE